MSFKLVRFFYIYWLWRSSLQHSHTTVWACECGWERIFELLSTALRGDGPSNFYTR